MKTIFVVQGYEQKNEQGSLLDVVSYEIYAKNSKEAIKKAKQYIKKPFYRIRNVIEK